MSEFHLHLAIKKHYDSCFIGTHNPNLKIMHIANENRDSAQGFFNKMLGVERGFPDILVVWPSHVAVCEIKLPGKPLSAAQNRFISWANLIGWHTGIARSVRQFHELMILWGLNPSHSQILEADYASKDEKLRRGEAFFSPWPDK